MRDKMRAIIKQAKSIALMLAVVVLATSQGVFAATADPYTWAPAMELNPLPAGALGMGEWKSDAMSSDGSKIIVSQSQDVSGNTGKTYLSSDSGATWHSVTAFGEGEVGEATAMSGDGSKLGVSVYNDDTPDTNNFIYISNDGGQTWAKIAGLPTDVVWTAITISRDGSKIIAEQGGDSGLTYVSSDGGTTWTQTALPGLRATFAMTPDGGKIIASATKTGAYSYISSDGGSTWTTIPALGTASNNFASYPVAISDSGQEIIQNKASTLNISHDGGATWTSKTSLATYGSNILLSSNGMKIVVPNDGKNNVSTDGGTTWSTITTPISNTYGWAYSAMTPDGTNLIIASTAAMTHSMFYVSHDGGTTWAQKAVSDEDLLRGRWKAVDMSANGNDMIAVQGSLQTNNSAKVVISHDGGATWTTAPGLPTGVNYGYTAAISGDGSHMVVGQWNGPSWLSTDSGATWTQLSSDAALNYASLSYDGSTILLSDNSLTQLSLSVDGGTTWKQVGPEGTWEGVTMSHDGSKMVAIQSDDSDGNPGNAYVSDNHGTTWTQLTQLPAAYWDAAAMSSDGQQIVVGEDCDADCSTPGWIYMSHDGGTTWTQNTAAGMGEWGELAMSSDGQTLLALPWSHGEDWDWSPFYLSTDGGDSWVSEDSVNTEYPDDWQDVAMSSDGSKVVVSNTESFLYMGTTGDSGGGTDSGSSGNSGSGNQSGGQDSGGSTDNGNSDNSTTGGDSSSGTNSSLTQYGDIAASDSTTGSSETTSQSDDSTQAENNDTDQLQTGDTWQPAETESHHHSTAQKSTKGVKPYQVAMVVGGAGGLGGALYLLVYLRRKKSSSDKSTPGNGTSGMLS